MDIVGIAIYIRFFVVQKAIVCCGNSFFDVLVCGKAVGGRFSVLSDALWEFGMIYVL